MTTDSRPRPLSGLRVIERFGPGSSDLGRAAVSFAGLLALRFGAIVLRMEASEPDPLGSWPPLLHDGSSAVHRFLTASKGTLAPEAVQDGDFLLTDDESVAASWGDDRRVLVRSAFGAAEGRIQSDLTAMAASGLLDIVGEVGRPPLGLPGFQISYATGLAAFDALLASHLSAVLQGRPVAGEVAALEVARWLNWKNLLVEVSGHRESGIGRPEEWIITPCKDGFIAPVFRDRDMPNLAKLLREPRLLEARFSSAAKRRANLAEVYELIGAALADRTAADVAAEAAALKLPIGQVQTPAEVAADPQMLHRHFIIDGPHGPLPRLPLLWNGAAIDAEAIAS